ncbi:uncharacterized protein LOC111612972 [Centruroides sculpturatus]|uniref:uncharacterized protein LOC111612972 n=1 Tax=Centruroides sculpturatus TaxID=218467 RepID=UPI000C6DC6BD|nr:uncharacterized protein LOC111612972 [Centruroides sculpturatus]
MKWATHQSKISDKAIRISHALQSICSRKWGLGEKAIKIIYKACIETIILYGAPFWAEAVDNVRARKKLNKAQRFSLIRKCRSYRTAPTEALQVISGVLPLYIRAKEEMWKWNLNNGGTIDNPDSDLYKYLQIGLFPNLNEYNLKHFVTTMSSKVKFLDVYPSTAGDISLIDFNDSITLNFNVYTDGSKSDCWTGAAFAIMDHQNITNFKASFKHIQVAIHRLKNGNDILANLTRQELLSCHNKVAFTWVKGHSGIEGNNIVDQMAKQAAASSATPTYWEAPKKIINNATVCLHNYLRTCDIRCLSQESAYCTSNYVDSEGFNGEIKPGQWRYETETNEAMTDITTCYFKNSGSDAKKVRELFQDFFMSEQGRLPWQNEVVTRGSTPELSK